jgi:acyl dehydratase|tara:strand:- start:165 stop:617 length:453 start_codon:yes stop_codon:yes gene_type:complete
MVNKMGNYYDDFIIGDLLEHSQSKTIFESDNNLFSLLTLNGHPIHTNIDYAEKSQHKQILVVGTLVFSLAVGITVSDISGKAIANLEYMSVKHTNPVFVNDTIYVKSIILDKTPSSSKKDRGVVHVESKVYNQNGEVVLIFERKVLIKKR